MTIKTGQLTAQALSFADAVKNARAAFDEERLGAQNGHRDCLFHYEDGSVCAIGASIKTVPSQSNYLSVTELVDCGLVTTTEQDENLMEALQELHDHWLDLSHGHLFEPTDLMNDLATRLTLPQWTMDWCRSNQGKQPDATLFEDFLITAERELGL